MRALHESVRAAGPDSVRPAPVAPPVAPKMRVSRNAGAFAPISGRAPGFVGKPGPFKERRHA